MKQYLTDGKLNRNTKTFWKLCYGAMGEKKSVQVSIEDLPKIKIALQTDNPVTIGGVTITHWNIASLEPDYRRFADWADDNLVTEVDGVYRYYIQDRTDNGIKKIADPIHSEINALMDEYAKIAISQGKVQEFISAQIDKLLTGAGLLK